SGVAMEARGIREATTTMRAPVLPSRPTWAASTLLGRLRPELRDQVLQLGVERVFPRSHTIIRHGDYVDRAGLLVRGTAKVVTSSEDGRLALLGVARAGDLADDLVALYHLESQASVVTCGAVTARLIDGGALRAFLRSQPDAHFAVTQLLTDKLREANRGRADRVLPGPCRRAPALVDLAAPTAPRAPSGACDLPACLTQAERGSLAGMARRTVEEQLRDLQRGGIVALA